MSTEKNKQRKARQSKRQATAVGATVLGYFLFGALCSEVGLSAGLLVSAGLCAIGIPVAVFVGRHGDRFARLLRSSPDLQLQDRSGGHVVTTDFRFWVTRRGIQFLIDTDEPVFAGQRFVRVIHDGVPNGILYEVRSHFYDEEREAEGMEIEVSGYEPLGRGWDKDLRKRILANSNLRLEVAFDPQTGKTSAGAG